MDSITLQIIMQMPMMLKDIFIIVWENKMNIRKFLYKFKLMKMRKI